MRRVALGVALAALGCATALGATPVERRVYDTRRATSAPVIDGRLDDAAWDTVEWSSEFIQREPAEGKPPTKQTRFKVLYDDTALYLGFRAFDDPQRLASLLARRDRFPGDWIEVNIDSYADHRTAFSFNLSLSGTRGDEFVSNDGDNWDGNWDPVWTGATHVDEEGWTGEMRIPLSQLRFGGADKQTWGLQVMRRIFRQEERSTWQPIPKDAPGWVSRFGELRGIEGIKPHRRLEVLPYGVGRAERFPREPGNPFRQGGTGTLTAGADAKLGVSSNFTLDVTANPDFGQVEADPSEVNLTAFESFFEEKRPFFVEGGNIFDLRLAPAITGGAFTSDRLFYSRRIGGRPPHSPDLNDGEYADAPGYSSILGAAKLSGKTPGGLSVGLLDSVSSHEDAEIDRHGLRSREAVAPLTNFLVGRVQQDWHGGDTRLGGMFTAVNRDASGELAFLPRQAYAGGIDFAHYLGKRAYLVEGNLMTSHLQGTPEAIADVQTSSARYFQRPDNEHSDFDPTRTSLGGGSSSLRLTRTVANSRFRFQTGAAWRSPGFEINDVGFMRRADEINQFGWAAYQIRNPFSIFNRFQWNVNEWLDWDSSGRFLRAAGNTNMNANFRNNYQIGGSLTRERESVSNTELRGGPSSKWPGTWNYDAYVGSDARKPLSATTGFEVFTGDDNSQYSRRFWMDLSYRPTNALTLTVSPSATNGWRDLQYIDTESSAVGDRYLFGRLAQKTLSLTMRVDLAITPNLTVQYYGAPFASSGSYTELKRITDPLARAYRDRFRVFGPELKLDAGGRYAVDENRDGVSDYGFDRPDFDVREFNSTLVVRWEYRPGSQIFAVWSQARSDDALRAGALAAGRGLREVFHGPAHDVFLVKFSRWFSL